LPSAPAAAISPELLEKQKQDEEQRKRPANLMTEALQSADPSTQMRRCTVRRGGRGFDKDKWFDLNQEVSHIGAVAQDEGARNDVVIRDVERLISRFHCEIHNHNGKLFLIDCHSANGTSVNGKRLAPGQPVRLKNGSRVTLARGCTLQVRFDKWKKQSA
jgi:hypothetical protein